MLFHRCVETRHIPKLLRMLERCYCPYVFEYIWKTLDEENFELVTEFMWKEQFIDVFEPSYSTGPSLADTNMIQFRVVQEIVNRSELKFKEWDTLKSRNEVYKCLFLQDFEEKFLKDNEHVKTEISQINAFQSEVALLGMEELSSTMVGKENVVLAKVLSQFIGKSCRCYKHKMIDIAFNDPKSVPREFLVDFCCTFLSKENFDEEVGMFRIAVSKLGDATKQFECAKKFFCLNNLDGFDRLSKVNRKFFLRFLFDLGAIKEVSDFMTWLSWNHPLEIRLFEDEIDVTFVQKMRPYWFFDFSDFSLSRRTQKRFLGEFCEAIESGDFAWQTLDQLVPTLNFSLEFAT
jgi:hypothetical protein